MACLHSHSKGSDLAYLQNGEQSWKHPSVQTNFRIINNNPHFLFRLSDVCISFVFNWWSLIKPSPWCYMALGTAICWAMCRYHFHNHFCLFEAHVYLIASSSTYTMPFEFIAVTFNLPLTECSHLSWLSLWNS